MHTKAFLIGAGGHGRVVLDAMNLLGVPVELYDSDPLKSGTVLDGLTIHFFNTSILRLPELGHVAIGNNFQRCSIVRKLHEYGSKIYTIVHPSAVVSKNAQIGDGVFVAACSVLAPNVCIGEGTIINHGAIVDHDCSVGNFCHIAPNVTIGGGVSVGDGAFIGSGATILPNLRVGDGVIVGAGAVVTHDLKPSKTVIGVPARELR